MRNKNRHSSLNVRAWNGEPSLDDDIDVANEYAQRIVDVAIANAHAHAETPTNDII